MMTQCPQCGSREILPDLVVFGGYQDYSIGVVMIDPKKKSEHVAVGIRAAVCGNCGHAELYTKYPQDLVEAKKKGYVTQMPDT